MAQTKNRKKALRKKRLLQRFFILTAAVLIIFFLGFFFGMRTASKSKEIHFQTVSVAPPAKTDESALPVQELPWNLKLVNFENPLDADFEPKKLKELSSGDFVDERIYEPVKEMLNAARADGVRILCVSGYRSYDRQEMLFKNKVKKLQKTKGYSVDKARKEAGTEVAVPGTSEHQLGLALDLTDASYTGLDKKQETTAAFKWLCKHCHEYGFIVRYPAEKTEITGIIYEPWHFRYVGKEAAAEITEKGITLEEYLEELYS